MAEAQPLDARFVKLEPRSVSESSILVELPELPDHEANRAAVALAQRLRKRTPRGLLEAIPGARTLFLVFDPETLRRDALVRHLQRVSGQGPQPESEGRLFRFPVAYGADAGPDLEALARDRGTTGEEIARLHASADYRVAFLGFAPGFAYLTGLPGALVAPRRRTPRPRVAAGSVAIAGEYSAVYPEESPGGWNLIGRCAVRLFDAGADPPALLSPGDRVRFEPIPAAELERRLDRRTPPTAAADAADRPAVLEVLAPGLFTSVQGAPRFGLGASGVAAGGAMDLDALVRGNRAVGNAPGAAGLEITLSGPELRMTADRVVCVTGGDLDARHAGRPVERGVPFEAAAGEVLSFGYAKSGARAYLSVRGGLDERRPGEPVRRLAKGDRVAAAIATTGRDAPRVPASLPATGGDRSLRVLPGPQADFFASDAAALFYSATYRVSAESDRRGLRLEGPPLPLGDAADLPPEGTALGAVQVPSNGLPIVLGPDRPVTGGYAKIGTLVAADWALLAQAPPGTEVRFRPATFEEIGLA